LWEKKENVRLGDREGKRELPEEEEGMGEERGERRENQLFNCL
jgi:hypothetical protein